MNGNEIVEVGMFQLPSSFYDFIFTAKTCKFFKVDNLGDNLTALIELIHFGKKFNRIIQNLKWF